MDKLASADFMKNLAEKFYRHTVAGQRDLHQGVHEYMGLFECTETCRILFPLVFEDLDNGGLTEG